MDPQTRSLIIWYVLFGGVLLPVNAYIYMRGRQALPGTRIARRSYTGAYLFLSLSYFIGRAIERLSVCAASDVFFWIGSLWFGFLLYFFIAALLADAARLANRFLPFLPAKGSPAYDRVKHSAFAAAVAAAIILQGAGFIHARNTRVTRLAIEVPKRAGDMRELSIALATDIHLGTIISNGRLADMVNTINGLEPDIVLLGGDIVDEDVAPVLERNMGALLANLRSRFGTFAVTGNHEYYGDAEKTCRYLERSGVTMLRDRVVRIGGRFYLAGRDEATKETIAGGRCLPLDDILAGIDTGLPVILMDHNPARMSETKGRPVDLSLGGHTHDGQLWPIGLITERVYEISRGYRKIGATHFFVSQGFGTWGPPVRIGTDSEIVHIMLRFRQ